MAGLMRPQDSIPPGPAPDRARSLPSGWIMAALGLAVAAFAVGGAPPDEPFSDVAHRLAVDFRLENSPTWQKYLLETMGGGVALLDYDNDGRLDIFFANGAKLDDPHAARQAARQVRPQVSGTGCTTRSADGTFSDVTEKAGLTGMPQNRYGMGVAVGDYDNDGFADLYVTGYGGEHAVPQQRRRHLHATSPRARAWPPRGWSTSAGFFDYDNDGKLDLLRRPLRGVDLRRPTATAAMHKPGGRAYCHPDNFEGVANILYRNNGDGTFTDVSAKAGIANPQGKALGVAFADYDGDGWTDIYVANDSVQCFLYRNNGDGTFTRAWRLPPGSASTRTARPSPAWAWISPTTTTTAGPTSW